MENDPPTSTDTAITNFHFRPDFFSVTCSRSYSWSHKLLISVKMLIDSPILFWYKSNHVLSQILQSN